MKKKKHKLAIQREIQIDESQIFERMASIIETRKTRAGMYANRELTLMYWEVGHYINSLVLNDGRAEYGKKILPSLAAKLRWSHFRELLTLQSDEARLFYANDAATRNYGAKELRRQISRKVFERREIANTGLAPILFI